MKRIFQQIASMMIGGALVALVFVAVRAGAQGEIATANSASPQQGAIVDAVFDVQSNIQYQGLLLDSSNNPKPGGTYNITFRLYDALQGGAVVWQETQDVVVADGFFSVALGKVSSLPNSIFNNKQLFLGVQVSGDSEMAPRQQLTVSPYAYWAYTAQKADKSESTDKLNTLRAYGVVNADGSKHRGFNFTSSRQTIGGELTFEIAISGEDYNLNDYVTTVTVVKNSECTGSVNAMTGSTGGRLLVDLFDKNGSRIYCKFHFQTLKLD